MATVASINLWSLMNSVRHEQDDHDNVQQVLKAAGMAHNMTELTMEVTDVGQWIIRIHGVEGDADFVTLTYGRAGHVSVEVTERDREGIVISRKVAW